MIVWRNAQAKLASKGMNPGPADGLLGRRTLGALFGLAAGRAPDETLISMGAAALVHLGARGILDTPQRLADWTAQAAHESAGFARWEENMRYSAKRLCAVWPRRFPTVAAALPYAWDSSDPDLEDKALANLVYGSRMGNERDGTADDDGWDYRGRGMGLTGATNYAAADASLGLGLVRKPELAAEPELAVLIFAWFWDKAGCGKAVDRGDNVLARKLVNGGTIGLDDVNAIRGRLLGVLQ